MDGRSMSDALLGRLVSVASRGQATDEEVDFVARNIKAAIRLPRVGAEESGDVRIRGAARSDVKQLQEIYAGLNSGHQFERKWMWLLKAMAPRLCIVAQDKSAGIVGFILFYFNDRDLRERTVHEGFIGVLPAFQGRGIGTEHAAPCGGAFQRRGSGGNVVAHHLVQHRVD